MDELQKLIAIEQIKGLMARRVRCIDEKDWEGFAACYADDAESHSMSSAPGGKVVGNRQIAEWLAKALSGITTVHQVHLPEIEVISGDAAKGIWPLNDILSWEKDGERQWMRGYGHYRQTLKKIAGRWVISEHYLTRLLVERGAEKVSS
jgi:ketosteroid isomerase-like protein